MKSIRAKLWLGMAILLSIFFILLWLFQIVFLESFYSKMRIAEIKDTAKSIIISNNNTININSEVLDNFAYTNNLNIEILDYNGKITITFGNIGTSGHSPLSNSSSKNTLISDVLDGKETITTQIHPRFDNKFVFIGLPIQSNGVLKGAVIITMPLAPVEDTANILRKQLIYIFLILAPIGLIISYIIAKNFTKPILNIKKSAEAMVEGNFNITINSTKSDEIGDLSKTINNLGVQLSKIDKLRKDLIANVSHELRTPLSIIRGYAETIKDVTGSNKQKREVQLDIIIDETERLSKIVDDILNLSQLQSGIFNPHITTFKIKDLLNNAISRFELISQNTNVNLEQRYNGTALVSADESRIDQVIFNLINNGFNHTTAGGSIIINVLESDNKVKVLISDTGSGISEEDLPTIWDRYYKSDKTKERRNQGTGLGLAIVKEVLESHKVAYGVESNKDIGTTFWFEMKKHLN